jgi:cellulose synthase (UDP-forming)
VSCRGYSFQPTTNLPANGNAILFITPRRPIAGIALPRIDGPALAIVANPHDSYGSLLLVMGRDERELKIAAAVLATSAGALGGDYASVAGARIPITAAYAAPRWLATDRPVPLGEIVSPLSLQGQGLPPGPLTAAFRIAPDLFFWPNRGARLNFGYTYPVAPWLDRRRSRLDLSLNGQYLRTYGLSGSWWERLKGASGSTSRHSSGSAVLPSYALFGQNEISLYYDLQVADKRRCSGTLPTNVKAGIDPTSTIDLRGAHHAALMPDLALLAGAAFPFTRTPDLGETAAILPARPTAAEIEAFLALMGRSGDATGTAPTRLTVLRTADETQLAGKDILVVGRASLAQGPLFDGAPMHWDGNGIAITQRSRISRVWDFLGPNPQVGTAPVDQSLLRSSSVTGMTSFRSPFDPQRSVIAFLATEPDDLPDLVYDLADRRLNAQVQGDLALLAGDRIRSFRVGSTYWSGSLPWWIKTSFWMSQHPLLLGIAAILAALLLSLPAYALLRAQQRRRLGAVEEPRA